MRSTARTNQKKSIQEFLVERTLLYGTIEVSEFTLSRVFHVLSYVTSANCRASSHFQHGKLRVNLEHLLLTFP
jgi:hypothetical protein